MDLDPVFADAAPGKGFAKVEKTYSFPTDDLFPSMMISLSIEKEKGREDILMLEESVQTLSNQPLTLSISTSFQESEEEGSSGGSPGGHQLCSRRFPLVDLYGGRNHDTCWHCPILEAGKQVKSCFYFF